MASTTSKNFSYEDESDSRKVLSHLNAQRVSSRFCDVVLKVCGDNIYAHSNVLAAASPYFSSFLGMGQDFPRAFSQKIPQVIEIHIDGSDGTNGYGEAVRSVVDYMYTSKIYIAEDIFTQVLEIAKIMQMGSIISFCENSPKPDEKINTLCMSADSQLLFSNENLHVNSSFEDVSDMPKTYSINAKNEGENDKHETEIKEELKISKELLFDAKVSKPRANTKGQSQRKKRKQRHSLILENQNVSTSSSDEIEEFTMDKECDDKELGENNENSETNILLSRGARKRKLTMKMKALKKSSRSKDSGLQKQENVNTGAQSEKSPRGRIYQCDECPYSTDTKYHFDRHCQAHVLAVKKYTCDECGFTTSKCRELSKHKDEHLHANLQCSICLFQAEDKESFKTHLNKHNGPQPFFCHTCHATFSNKTKLQLHLPKHSIKQPFVCELCNRGFKWKHALKSHMVTHSKSKDHLCDVCGFATAHKSQLKAHKLIHTGETYKCTVCPFQATKKQNLKYHMLTHTHEKPHQCEVCGQSFSLNKNMKRHMLLHSNERPYKCDQCGFSAARGDKLKEHQLKAHGIGDFPKKKHRLSDYYNSLVPPDPNPTLEDLAAKFNITLPQKSTSSSDLGSVTTITTVPVLVDNPADDGEDKPNDDEVSETHVIIDGDQSFPVSLTKVTEGELTYQFCYAD